MRDAVRGKKQYRLSRAGVPSQSSGEVLEEQVSEPVVCAFCDKTGHSRDVCWSALGRCLLCGLSGHRVAGCPKSKRQVAGAGLV